VEVGGFQRTLSIDRVMGASPLVGGLRGSSSTGNEIPGTSGGGKKVALGNSKVLGEKRLGVGGSSTSVAPKLREKD